MNELDVSYALLHLQRAMHPLQQAAYGYGVVVGATQVPFTEEERKRVLLEMDRARAFLIGVAKPGPRVVEMRGDSGPASDAH